MVLVLPVIVCISRAFNACDEGTGKISFNGYLAKRSQSRVLSCHRRKLPEYFHSAKCKHEIKRTD